MIEIYKKISTNYDAIRSERWFRIWNKLHIDGGLCVYKEFVGNNRNVIITTPDDINQLLITLNFHLEGKHKMLLEVSATSREFAEMVETMFIMTDQ